MISVLIPAFRAEAFIARAVSSVLAQSMQDFEIVIAADDGKDYAAVLASQSIMDTRLHFVTTGGVGKGAAVARNAAKSAAKASLIATLDADDEFLPGYLECMIPLALKHGFVITQVEYRDHETGKLLSNRAKPFTEGSLALQDVLLACLHTYSPIVFDRKRVTHDWNERIPLLEDAVFLAETYNALPAVWYASESSYCYYRRDNSVCNAAEAAQRFLDAGRIITGLLDNSGIPSTNPQVGKMLKAYIERNNRLELAFERSGLDDYQDFIGRNIALLHSPLI